LVEKLAEAGRITKARRVRFEPLDEVETVDELPAGIRLVEGLLQVEFYGTEDLLKQLNALVQAVMHDYPRFQAICEGLAENGRKT
jgi:hypothetical protein